MFNINIPDNQTHLKILSPQYRVHVEHYFRTNAEHLALGVPLRREVFILSNKLNSGLKMSEQIPKTNSLP